MQQSLKINPLFIPNYLMLHVEPFKAVNVLNINEDLVNKLPHKTHAFLFQREAGLYF